MFEERRAEPRERLELPLKLGDGRRVVTRDVSPSGMFFETNADYLINSKLEFDLVLLEAQLKFTSSGEIVRIERSAGRTGVAIRLIDTRMEIMEQKPGCPRELICLAANMGICNDHSAVGKTVFRWCQRIRKPSLP